MNRRKFLRKRNLFVYLNEYENDIIVVAEFLMFFFDV